MTYQGCVVAQVPLCRPPTDSNCLSQRPARDGHNKGHHVTGLWLPYDHLSCHHPQPVSELWQSAGLSVGLAAEIDDSGTGDVLASGTQGAHVVGLAGPRRPDLTLPWGFRWLVGPA